MSAPNMVHLGEIAEFVRGINFKPDDVVPVGSAGTVACMRTKNVQSELDLSDVWAVDQSFMRREDQCLQEGDILVSSANSWNLVGKCSWIPALPYRATFGGFVSVLRATSSQLNRRYLYRWFSSEYVQETLRSFGQKTTNISNLNIGRCERLQLPLPPLEEQRRIAAILDQAETLRTQRRAALAQLDSLTQSLFLEMFGAPDQNPKGWPARELHEVVKPGAIVTYGIVQAGEEFPGGVPYIRTGDLVNGSIRLTELRHTDPELAAKFSRSRVETNEIVMSIRATVGTTALVPAELHGANLTQGTARIAPGEDMHFYYLLYFLRSDSTQHWIDRQVKGATFREITLGRLRELPVLVPPLALQQTFATRIQAIEALKTTQRAALAELDALFASLQQRAFSGELTRLAATVQAAPAKARDFSELCQLEAAKGLEALIYVAKRMPQHDKYKSLKALYFADKHHLEHHGTSIYGETYCALQHGPVPQAAYDLTRALEGDASNDLFADDALRATLRLVDHQLIPSRDADFSKLGAAERQSLDWAIRYCGSMNFEQTKTASHDSAYRATPPNAPMAMEEIVRMLPQAAQRRFWG